MNLDKLNIMLKNGTITQNEYNEMKSKLGTKGKKQHEKRRHFINGSIIVFSISNFNIWGTSNMGKSNNDNFCGNSVVFID